jgi:predicted permease
VALFAIGVVVITGMAGGIAQSVASAGASWIAHTSRMSSTRTSTALVAVQIALSVVLLVGAGLLVKGFLKVAPSSPGFNTERRATLELNFLAERDRKATATEAIERVRAALRTVPGVSDVSASTWLPLTGNALLTDVATSTPAEKRRTAHEYFVSDNYFQILGMQVRSGRSFTPQDRRGSEAVVVINETDARRWFGQTSPLGTRIAIGQKGIDQRTVTVVGVVNDTRVFGESTDLVSQIYVPIAQEETYRVTFVAATSIPPTRLLPALRRAATAAAPQASINKASEIAAIVAESTQDAKFFSVSMAMFATAAVVLSGLGVYGLLAFVVTQRRKEIGIRMALGAAPSRIGRGILKQAVLVAVVGASGGLVASLALTRYMESLLVEVKATDATAFSVAIVVAIACALLAAAAPVIKAVRIDPIETIRA